MKLEEIIEAVKHDLTYFKEPQTEIQMGRVFEADKILNMLNTYQAQLQQHNVMGWRPDHKTIRAAAATYADDMCKLFENDTETKRYCKNDFIAGAEWALSQAACP